ncbi:peptidase S41 [Deinococcus knuensis]|uniref:Peptidase S41 n=2 Tax=Deinococcus knuensis TaxID=1837380 RepID=A0ABQ2SZ72_9DEIO|nr:peptidase S41 [Deinococcus knuensis]
MLITSILLTGFVAARDATPATLETPGGREFMEAVQTLDRYYYQDIDWEAAWQGALSGLLESLGNKQTYYLRATAPTPTETPQYGFGLMVNPEQSSGLGAQIDFLFDSGSGKRAGLQRGDVLLSIDDQYVRNKPLEEVINIIRGEQYTTATVTVLRGTQTLSFTVKREPVQIVSVSTAILPGNVGYIAVTTLYDTKVAERVAAALVDFKKRNVQSMILDLRDSGGGLVDNAVNVADQFMSGGPILVLSAKSGFSQNSAIAKRDITDYDGKLLVLVNRNTAGGAEIIAGALQDLKRATVVGEITSGTGLMQTPFSLGDRAQKLMISTTEAIRPAGQPIQGKGITPDVLVMDSRFQSLPTFLGQGLQPGETVTLVYRGETVVLTAGPDGKVIHASALAPAVLTKGAETIDLKKDTILAAAYEVARK